MGYRSEVIVALTKEKTKQFLLETSIGPATAFVADARRYEKNGWFMFHYEWVKWYEDYSDVQAVMNFLNILEAEGSDEFEYHCMGEESDDYTVMGQGNSPFDISMSRSLSFDT